MWERLDTLAEHFGGVAKLAELTGISYTTLKGTIDEGRKGINTETAEAIVRKTGCSPRWLLTGEGEMLEDAQGNRPVVVHFRHAAGHGQPGEHEGESDSLVAIPVLRDASAAGPGRIINESDIESVGVIYKGWCPHPEKTDYVRVAGDSMLPTLPDGSLVTIDKSEADPQRLKGQVVAVWIADRDEVTIKRLRYDAERKIWKAIPDNITETNLPFDLAPEDRVIGKVRSVHAEVK